MKRLLLLVLLAGCASTSTVLLQKGKLREACERAKEEEPDDPPRFKSTMIELKRQADLKVSLQALSPQEIETAFGANPKEDDGYLIVRVKTTTGIGEARVEMPWLRVVGWKYDRVKDDAALDLQINEYLLGSWKGRPEDPAAAQLLNEFFPGVGPDVARLFGMGSRGIAELERGLPDEKKPDFRAKLAVVRRGQEAQRGAEVKGTPALAKSYAALEALVKTKRHASAPSETFFLLKRSDLPPDSPDEAHLDIDLRLETCTIPISGRVLLEPNGSPLERVNLAFVGGAKRLH
jgi:hypothetical protein